MEGLNHRGGLRDARWFRLRDLGGAPSRLDVGRRQQAHHGVSPSQPLVEPLLPVHSCRDVDVSITVQEYLVAIVD
jgi:hypothetical protein